MRPLEVLLVVLIALAAVCLLVRRWRQAGPLLLAFTLAVALLHGFFEGAHWQMIPAYAAVCVLSAVVWWRRGIRSDGRRGLEIFVVSSALLLTAATMLLSFVLPMFRLPKPTGPYPVGTTILYFKDSTRIDDAAPGAGSPRELMVQLWYPAQDSSNPLARYRRRLETNLRSSYQAVLATNSRLDAPLANAGAPFPVILFNHAWDGRRTNDTFLTEELASHGYVVASIDHTYNASRVAFPDGRVVKSTASFEIDDPESSTQARVRAIWDKELVKWAADQRFILDRLEEMNRSAGTPWFGHMNTQLAGAIGHSFGGAASTEICAIDPRIHASVNMDGWFFGAIRARRANQPMMFVDATMDPVASAANPYAKVEAALDASDEEDIQGSLHLFGGYRLYIHGAEHDDFTDQPLVSPLRSLSHRGTLPANRVQSMVRIYVLAFFDKTLKGADPEILRAQTSPFSEATLANWPTDGNKLLSSIRSGEK